MNPSGKYDLKSMKTKTALDEALMTLLEKHSFEKIAVRNICEEALISRTTFYAHYTDKYDFLKHWLTSFVMKYTNHDGTYSQTTEIINKLINENKKIVRNIFRDARKETLEALSDLILTTLNFSGNNEKNNMKSIVISNFYAGGVLFYLLWQIEHKFPQDVPPMNEHIYEIINCFQILLDKGDC